MLDIAFREQLKPIFADLKANYEFDITVSPRHESRGELLELLDAVADSSEKISCRLQEGEGLAFSLLKNGVATGVRFRGTPNGHEFTSLVMAILNSEGRGKNIPDEGICRRVRALRGPIELKTYVSLTCTNCPDVVQSLNLMALLNDGISHEMVDGGIYLEEVERLHIQGVPAVFADGELLHSGRSSFGELLEKLEAKYGVDAEKAEPDVHHYDVVVIGGGPAGSSAAIYSARKGLKVAVLAERAGGQVNETVGIENIVSVRKTTGAELAANLKFHIQDYPIDLFEHRRVEKIECAEKEKIVWTKGGEQFVAPALIVATGASWRRLHVAGESEYIGRGVAFCPHCDGPFYKDKRVAVVGGGNSGMEAAIDLAGICREVTVFEFLDELKADRVLQDKAAALSNVTVFRSTETKEIIGNGDHVTAVHIRDRKTGKERIVELDGIFVQIGLAANSEAFRDVLTTNRAGEIEIDDHCRTNLTGIYAAGDVTTTPYKQIIIAMGEGAKAALTAFEDRIRGIV